MAADIFEYTEADEERDARAAMRRERRLWERARACNSRTENPLRPNHREDDDEGQDDAANEKEVLRRRLMPTR